MSAVIANIDALLKQVNGAMRQLMQARMALEVQRQKAEMQSGADDLVPDPRYAVPVSRQGMDQPARYRETDLVTIPVGVKEEIEARRVRTGLARMHRDGTIKDRHLQAAEHFLQHFTVIGYDMIGTVDLNGASGGGAGIEARLDRTADSRKIVQGYFHALGGEYTAGGQVIGWIVGLGTSMNDFIEKGPATLQHDNRPRHFWMGVLVNALDVMAAHFEGLHRPRNNAMRADANKGELKIPDLKKGA